ncbi:hypothetical protein K1719_027933 [Acacia pycnantha]|nr:hypothetical protein K1719_027933 [Acacia pycnantha]
MKKILSGGRKATGNLELNGDWFLRLFEDGDEPPSDPDSVSEWDEFGDSDYHKCKEELDPGSWRPIFESDTATIAESGTESEAIYYSG